MNELLRRALFRARLAEEDVAAHLGVDPKTVRRWLEGRTPYRRHRLAVAHLLGAEETDLWPDVDAAWTARSRPEEIKAVYPHRWAVPHEVWHQLFGSAQDRIGVLVYSGLFLAEDVGLTDIFGRKARGGVNIRIALGDPDSPHIAERGAEEGIDDAMRAKVRNALALYKPLLDVANASIRLHQATLYNSLFYGDNDMLVNQHVYGVLAANAPVFHLQRCESSDMFSNYVDSFERIWSRSKQVR